MKFNKDKLPTIEFDGKTYVAPIFQRENGEVICSAEESNSWLFCDYWGEHRGGGQFICDELEKWILREYGVFAYWDWESPGSLCVVT